MRRCDTDPYLHLSAVPTPCGTQADLAIGDEWTMKVDLPPVSFGVGRPVRDEMVDDINEALDYDVNYELPDNYLRGEGDSECHDMIVTCS